MLSWARRIFGIPETKSDGATLANPPAWLLEMFGAVATAAGRSVTPRQALSCPAVACAVRTIAEAIGQLPIHVYRREAAGNRERDTDHPAYKLVHNDANEWTSAGELRAQVTVDALLNDNGFALVNRVGDGRPYELIRLEPTGVTVRANDRGEPVYRLNTADGQRFLDRRDVIHICSSLSLDGLNGEAPIRLAREAIAGALAIEEHVNRLFGNGARPSGVLSLPGRLNEQAAKRIGDAWAKGHAGGSNAGKTAVLEEGAKWEPTTFNSVDAQVLELRKFSIEEISRAFRVPPHMLFELGRATWGNAEEMGGAFLTYSLMHWIKGWEAALNRALFTEEERKTHFAEFLVDDLLRADIAARSDAYSKLIASRVLNPNEARAMENRPPYAGGDAFENPNTTSQAAA